MKKGFTLSEVLITLAIVGVVAVLTIPGVMRNYKNKLYTAQLQKAYALIGEAAQAYMNDSHVDNFYETRIKEPSENDCQTSTDSTQCTKGSMYFLNNYFKTVKKGCNSSEPYCIAESYTSLDNAATFKRSSLSLFYCIQTVNGAAICAPIVVGVMPLSIFVDINGPAEPNIAGRDAFSMLIKKDGSIGDFGTNFTPGDSIANPENSCPGNTSSISASAAGCLPYIIKSGWKMEY